ncbi:Dop1p-like protein [Cryptosporidium canis]|nr:Dop1p-like protein [Cryptosporidium canis]
MSDFSWPKSEAKRYEGEIYSILQSFEKAQEWADLSNCLQRLNRCISKEFCETPGVPLKETVSKRLAQCLNPSLPSGVHIKALETYGGIFEKIGKSELSSDLALYGSGLFPFFFHSSNQVKPIFLDIIDQYFLPLGPCLLPCLSGLLVGLLPGLEDSKSECYDRIMRTFQSISSESCVGEKNFMCTLWLVILRTSHVRYPALEVIMTRFATISISNPIDHCQKIKNLIPCNILFLKALESCIDDDNILVKRYLLDFLISHVPLSKRKYNSKGNYVENILPYTSRINLLRRALRLFLLKEWSLTRRLLQWIMNDKYVGSEEKIEETIDMSIVNILNTAIIEELVLATSSLEICCADLENSMGFARYPLSRISRDFSIQQSYITTTPSNIIQPIKMINAFFEECTSYANLIAPKVLIPIFIYSRESTIKLPEIKDFIVSECKLLLISSKLTPSTFLDIINSSLVDNDAEETTSDVNNKASIVINPGVSLLKEIILFYVDNFLLTYDGEDKEDFMESFFIRLFDNLMKIVIETEFKNNMLVFTRLCTFTVNHLKIIAEKRGYLRVQESVSILKLFMEFLSSSLSENVFSIEEIAIRDQLYEILSSLFDIEAYKEILLNKTEMTCSTPFEHFSIPLWLYKLYNRITEPNFPEYLHIKLESHHIEDVFKCIKIIIEILFNSQLFFREETIPYCWIGCTSKITGILWNFLDSDLYKFHEAAVHLLIDLEKWVQNNFSRISSYVNAFNHPKIIRGNSILNELFINHLSTLEIDLKVINIKKLSVFMKYSTDSLYKIPPEVTFLILEGLDSNSIQLRSSCSIWVIQAMETPKLILDHLLHDLSGFEIILLMCNKLHYNEELDFARIVYSLERTIALISMEDIDIIQLLFETKVDQSIVPINIQYDIVNYFDAFVLICVALFTTEIPKSGDLRVECTAVNSLNFILSKSLNNSYNLSRRSFNFEYKLLNVILYITSPILESLQESIAAKKYPIQGPIIQLLNTMLLTQKKFINITDDLASKYPLISTNNQLFSIILRGIQQMPNITYGEKVELGERDCLIYSNNVSSISSYSSLIKPYIDFSLLIFEDLDQETLIQNVKSIIFCLSMELVVSLTKRSCTAIIQYLDSILKILTSVIGISPTSNVLCESKSNGLQSNSGFIYSLFGTQKTYQSKNYNIGINSITTIPKLLNYPLETTIKSITNTSKSKIINNTILILFGTLIETINFIHEDDLLGGTLKVEVIYPRILHYIDSIAFIIAWNASDAFIFSGIVCWSHVNNHLMYNKVDSTLNNMETNTGLRNTSIISIFQLSSIREFVNPASIFSVVGDYLSYFWLNSNNFGALSDLKHSHFIEGQNSDIPNYLIFFSKIALEKELVHNYKLWKESLVYHFLYTVLVTSSFCSGPNDFLCLWEVISALLNIFLQNPKQPKSILWFATILSTLDACMASSREVPASFFLDKRLINIFEDKKMVKNLNNLIYMVLYLVHENFSSKVAGAVPPSQFDKFPPLPPSIEAIIQSIEFDFIHESRSSFVDINVQPNNPKSIVSDDPSLLFSYYSMGFLIMYNTEIAFHTNNKRLFLRNIWGSCIVKSLDWAFQPLIKRNNNVANMIHKYFLLLHIDTFPFRIFPEYLSGIKKPVIEALNSPNFFCIDRRTFRCWTSIVSKLVSYDTTSLSAVGRSNILETYVSLHSMGIFSTRVAELQNRCNYIKRIAFLIFSCPQNTFQQQLSLILEKLVENLKLAPEYSTDSDSNTHIHFVYLAEQVMLCLRVLLLKVNYQSLMPLWPIVLAELIKIFSSKSHQKLKISAMKFVDLASLLDIPEFHLYQWIFVTDFFNTSDSEAEDSKNNKLDKDSLFSPFCNVSDSGDSMDGSVLGIGMETLDESFKSNQLKFPLIQSRNRMETNEDFVEMALQLNKNCLLNSVKSSKMDCEKLIQSIENDFLDFPDNLLDWSHGCDLSYLNRMISNQKSYLKRSCSKFSNI